MGGTGCEISITMLFYSHCALKDQVSGHLDVFLLNHDRCRFFCSFCHRSFSHNMFLDLIILSNSLLIHRGGSSQVGVELSSVDAQVISREPRLLSELQGQRYLGVLGFFLLIHTCARGCNMTTMWRLWLVWGFVGSERGCVVLLLTASVAFVSFLR